MTVVRSAVVHVVTARRVEIEARVLIVRKASAVVHVVTARRVEIEARVLIVHRATDHHAHRVSAPRVRRVIDQCVRKATVRLAHRVSVPRVRHAPRSLTRQLRRHRFP